MDYIQKIDAERIRLDQIAADDPELAAKFKRIRRVTFWLNVSLALLIGYGAWGMWQWADSAPIEETAPWMVGVAGFTLALNAIAPRIAARIAGIR